MDEDADSNTDRNMRSQPFVSDSGGNSSQAANRHRSHRGQEPFTPSFSPTAPNRRNVGDRGPASCDPKDKKPMDTKREAQQGPKMQGERPEHYNESMGEKLTGAIKEESTTEAAAEDKKPQYEPTTQARRRGEHDTDTFLDHHATGKKEHHEQTDTTHELGTALHKSSSTDKKETRINTYFEEEWPDFESTLFAATPYGEDNHPKDDIEELGSQHVQLRAQREALVPRSRSQEISPGAVWEGNSLGEDEGTLTFEEATEHMPSTETQDTQLISAERVHDPVLVSASIIDCLCCPTAK
jgi:hypothetical protein